MLTATIYTKPYIAHWLQLQYGSPVELPRGSNFRNIFLACLSKDLFPHQNKLSRYLARVEVKVNKDIVSQHGHTIAVSHQVHFTRILTEYMDHQLYIFITAQIDQHATIDEAIATFQQHMNYSEEIFALDTIRQRYFRYKRNLKNIFRSSVTNIPAK